MTQLRMFSISYTYIFPPFSYCRLFLVQNVFFYILKWIVIINRYLLRSSYVTSFRLLFLANRTLEDPDADLNAIHKWWAWSFVLTRKYEETFLKLLVSKLMYWVIYGFSSSIILLILFLSEINNNKTITKALPIILLLYHFPLNFYQSALNCEM